MKRKLIFHWFLAISILFSACSVQRSVSSEPLEGQSLQPDTKKTLTICLGEEPDSLFLYSAGSRTAKLILQAIYDGPIDIEAGDPQPVILNKIPNLEDGSAFFTPVEVTKGIEVINSAGTVVQLESGIEVFPTGCTSPQCAVIWDGVSPLRMDFITAEYVILPGLKWSDGQPLLASDSVYSFELASALEPWAIKDILDQTASFTATNDLTVLWTSKPGLVIDSFEKYFFSPLPEHVWGKFNEENLQSAEEVNRTPIGWGAYQVEVWIDGQSLHLSKNPNYARAGEGLPFFDELVFKFINPYGDTALSNLKFDRAPFQQFNYDLGEFEKDVSENGCDLTTTTSDLRDQLPVLNILLNYFKDPAIKVIKSGFSNDQIIFFRLGGDEKNASNPSKDLNVRKAVDLCLNRSKMISTLSFGLYELIDIDQILNSDTNSQKIAVDPHDPASGNALLDRSGWKDIDNNPKTPRVSEGVPGVPDGKELGFRFFVEDVDDNLKASEIVKASLAECGIGINIKPIPPEVFWDDRNSDSIFQGNYDLAQLSLKTPILDPCQLFSSRSIPSVENNFIGLNFSRFSDEIFDNDCSQIERTHLGSAQEILLDQMKTIINENLPDVPLYRYTDLIIAQMDFCTDEISNKSNNELSRIEDFVISPECK